MDEASEAQYEAVGLASRARYEEDCSSVTAVRSVEVYISAAGEAGAGEALVRGLSRS